MSDPQSPPPDGSKQRPDHHLERPQRTVSSGVRWHSLGAGSVQASRLLISVILANKLGLHLFGVMAAVQILVGFADYFKDAGIGQAIVRRPQLERGFLSTMFFANLAMGATITGVIWVLAEPLAQLINEPLAAEVLQWLGISVLITSTGVVQRNVYARMMRFDRLAMANMLNAIVYGISAITLVFLDFGIWAMVWGTLAGHVVGNAALWFRTEWVPRLEFHFHFLKDIYVFCLGVLGSNLTNHFLSNVDRAVVQMTLGSVALAPYAIAARLVTFPAQNLGRMLTSVMLPAFSRLQSDLPQYRENFLRACAGIAMLTCPMMAGLMAVAPTMVEALFTSPDWKAAIPLMIWMGPLGVVLAISLPLHAIYVSLGRSVELFVYGLLFGVVSLEAYLIGSTYGVRGVAIAGTLTHTVMAYFYFAVPFRFIDLKVRRLVKTLIPYLAASTVMGLLVWGCQMVLAREGVDARIALVLCVLLGVGIYGGIMLKLQTEALGDLKRFVGMKRAGIAKSQEVL